MYTQTFQQDRKTENQTPRLIQETSSVSQKECVEDHAAEHDQSQWTFDKQEWTLPRPEKQIQTRDRRQKQTPLVEVSNIRETKSRLHDFK